MVHAQEAFVTLVTSDDYGIGALVLAHSIRDAGTSRQLVCMITERVSALMQGRLNDVFDDVIVVSVINSPSLHNLHLLGRPDLLATFTKLHLWNLTQFSKVVFMDADTLALGGLDELFSHEELSACADIGWPDCFNSGVFVAKPAKETFDSLIAFAAKEGSFDGGDQGLLNDFFPNWHRLPFTFNVTPSASYSYSPAYRKYKADMKVVHFIGQDKPWRWSRYTDGSLVERGHGNVDATDLVRVWWKVHDLHIGRSALGSDSGFAGAQPSTPFGYQQFSNPAAKLSSESSGHFGGRNSDETPANPFFKSRYDWDANELGMGADGAADKAKLKHEDEDEEDGTRKLPLKKAAAKPAVKPAGPAAATPSAAAKKAAVKK